MSCTWMASFRRAFDKPHPHVVRHMLHGFSIKYGLKTLVHMVLAGCCLGCVDTRRDVTGVATPQYASIAAKTYVTQADLFLVHVQKDNRTYLVQRDDQYFPYDPEKFDGKEIAISYGGGSSITDVVVKGTEVEVVRIVNVSNFEMVYDQIHGRILTGKHAGEIVLMEDLFMQSDRSEKPTLPLKEYLKEREAGK